MTKILLIILLLLLDGKGLGSHAQPALAASSLASRNALAYNLRTGQRISACDNAEEAGCARGIARVLRNGGSLAFEFKDEKDTISGQLEFYNSYFNVTYCVDSHICHKGMCEAEAIGAVPWSQLISICGLERLKSMPRHSAQ